MNYLIIPSVSIGGSEIRLISCWILIKKLGVKENLKIIISKQVFELLKGRVDLFAQFVKFKDSVIVEEFPDSYFPLQKKLTLLLKNDLLDAKSVMILLHMPILYWKRKGQKLIYIHPGTTIFSNSNLKGIIGQLFCFLKADKVDVLDPGVYRIFRKISFYNRNKVKLTQFGISESHLTFPGQIQYDKKENSVVFLGNLMWLKQIEELLDCINFTQQELLKANIKDVNFIIIGSGPLEGKVDLKIKSLQNQGVNIKRIKSYSPYEFLYKAKVFFSLQLVTNYPSQSLIESILCGCLPIVTDCGDSKLLARDDFSFYVNEKFNQNEIAKQCVRILSFSQKEFSDISIAGINYVTNNFSPEGMARYYASFFRG